MYDRVITKNSIQLFHLNNNVQGFGAAFSPCGPALSARQQFFYLLHYDYSFSLLIAHDTWTAAFVIDGFGL